MVTLRTVRNQERDVARDRCSASAPSDAGPCPRASRRTSDATGSTSAARTSTSDTSSGPLLRRTSASRRGRAICSGVWRFPGMRSPSRCPVESTARTGSAPRGQVTAMGSCSESATNRAPATKHEPPGPRGSGGSRTSFSAGYRYIALMAPQEVYPTGVSHSPHPSPRAPTSSPQPLPPGRHGELEQSV